jgi:hypothetical protein
MGTVPSREAATVPPGGATPATARDQVVADLRRSLTSRAAPTGIRRDVLPVLGPLEGVLPHGGLPRGGVVSVVGTEYLSTGAGQRRGPDTWTSHGSGGASSLLLSLLAAPTPRWSAVVGLPEVGLLAAAELGADLDRLVVVPDPGPDVLHILSVLADGVELIVVGAPRGPWGTPARLRILTSRLRQHGTVLLVAGNWPGADLVLQARHTGWVGLGRGTGRLRDRELTIMVGGRRAGRPGRESTVRLSGGRDGSVVLDTATLPGAARREAPATSAIPAAM